MEKRFAQNVFTEYRRVVVDLPERVLTDDNMVRAITMNENLRSAYGFTFKPVDLIRIAKANKSAVIYKEIEEMIPSVKAKPMYPDFPYTCMNISEAEFRFHQMVHYFSTYGIEELFGVDVTVGWMPETDDTEKTKKDKIILPEKVISVLDESEAYFWVYKTILEKRERMTVPEKEMIQVCAQNLSPREMGSVSAAFKENLTNVFAILMDTLNGSHRVNAIHSVCQNTGDVFKCFDEYLQDNSYSLSTSQKKAVVKVLESYSVGDFKENLMLSNVKREWVLKLLRFLDYNKFSRSAAHREAVRRLRNNELQSWEGRFKAALAEDGEKGLLFAAERPGMLLRFVSMLMKADVDPDRIKSVLCECADKLSTQTLVRLCTYFSNGAYGYFENRRYDVWDGFDTDKLDEIFIAALNAKLASVATPIRGKKVYVDETQYDFGRSIIRTNDKSEEGGYIRSGLTFKLPADCKTIRLFTYWNDDDRRVDIDLSSYAIAQDGSSYRIGWNESFRTENRSILHSGDVTHSNAAEYIDIDLEKAQQEQLRYATLSLNCYTRNTFDSIDEVLVGIMGLSEMGTDVDVELYNPANCFFSHKLKSNSVKIFYGFLDLVNREITFVGDTSQEQTSAFYAQIDDEKLPKFSLRNYLDCLLSAQNCEIVDKESADVILRLDKGTNDKEISLIDENFWMDLS